MSSWWNVSNFGFARNYRRLQLWERAVEQHGMHDVMFSGAGWRARLTARSGPIAVRISDVRATGNGILVEIDGPEGLSALKLRGLSLLALGPVEMKTGDPAFDETFLIEEGARPAYALLDAKMRRQLIRARAECRSLEIGGGRLQVVMAEENLPRLLSLLLDIGRRLAEPLDVEHRIARNVLHDPQAGVRLANLRLLVQEHSDNPDILQTLRAACSDPSPEVRLRAAIERGDEGRDILLQLAEGTKDDDISARAVSHLGDELPLGRALAILTQALRKNLTRTALAGLEVLGRRKDAAVSTLARVMRLEKGELAIAAARALGETGAEAAEPPLIKALQNEDDALREAAAAALGKVGSAAAVQPLEDAAERSWLDLGLRRAARQAIAEIQSRREGASPGQLSLAPSEAGQLSLATDPSGQLSLPPER